MVEAVEPFKLHSVSMLYAYIVLEHFLLLWMGLWLHTHIVTTTDVSPDLGKLKYSLGNGSVQTMPLWYGWGCRTFQTAFHIHDIHTYGVGAPSPVVDRHMAAHSHHYYHRRFPKFGRAGWITMQCLSLQTIPLHCGQFWGILQTAISIHEIYM
jgi:hypothetical protein